ncbi:MAG: hypothetical protein KDB23_15025, partial [Planctomycetales bacterium]|nr:hypothetical protein [Planctomycetales bacterium]
MRRRHYIYLAACGLYLAIPGRVTLAQLSAPTKVFSNAYHVTATGASDGAVPDTQAGALEVVTNGIIDHGTGNGQVDGFDTWQSDNQGVGTDFVGLGYDSAATFDVVTVALGNQFVDGGDWQEPPKVYILKNPIMNSDMVRPEISPNWVEVSAVSFNLPEEEEHLFDSLVTQGPGGMVHFQLQGTAAERTGWGWAVGGVDGNENGADIFHFISVTELMASGEPAAPPAIIPPATPQPMNVVANSYHSPNYEGEDFTDLRGEVFQAITNGVSDFGDAGTPGDGFDTWENDASGTSTDFVGLQYNSLVEFDTIQIDLGFQFPDGGDWEEMPKVYILKNPVDTNQADPESDPNWVEVAAT